MDAKSKCVCGNGGWKNYAWGQLHCGLLLLQTKEKAGDNSLSNHFGIDFNSMVALSCQLRNRPDKGFILNIV